MGGGNPPPTDFLGVKLPIWWLSMGFKSALKYYPKTSFNKEEEKYLVALGNFGPKRLNRMGLYKYHVLTGKSHFSQKMDVKWKYHQIEVKNTQN